MAGVRDPEASNAHSNKGNTLQYRSELLAEVSRYDEAEQVFRCRRWLLPPLSNQITCHTVLGGYEIVAPTSSCALCHQDGDIS